MILVRMGTDCGDQTGHACLFQIGDHLIGSCRQTCIHKHGVTAGHDQRTVALSHVDEMYDGLLLHGIGDDLLSKTHKQLVRNDKNGQDTQENNGLFPGLLPGSAGIVCQNIPHIRRVQTSVYNAIIIQ